MKKSTFKHVRILLLIFSFVLSGSMYATSGSGSWSQTASYSNSVSNGHSFKKSFNHGKNVSFFTKIKKFVIKKKYYYFKKKVKGNGDAIPLDGGLSILLLGAAAFGAKKLRK